MVAVLLSLLLGGLALGGGHMLVLPSAPSGGVSRAQLEGAPPPRSSSGVSRVGLSGLPVGARGSVSGALGAGDPAYRVRAAGGGFRAVSVAQGVSARFGRGGVRVSSGGSWLGLAVRGVGYGASLGTVGPVAPRAWGNRVVYAHAGFSEWYANGPLGLEQGFTVSRAAAGGVAGPLTVSMALSGDVRASLDAGGRGLALSRGGGPSLRYGGLVASDAEGRLLHCWLVLRGRRVLLRVDARGARYPVRIDPFIQQGSKLTAGDESGAGQFGYSVALSADGGTALVGGPGDGGGVGAVWVFVRAGSTWTQQGSKLTGGEESGKGAFGSSVALSAEGSTALVGGPEDDGIGAAWVFVRAGSTWTQQGPKLRHVGASVKDIGFAVALSADGGTALVGGPGDGGGVGAVWVFVRAGSTWVQQGSKLTGGEESGSGFFGNGVALSGDGSTALIGGDGDSGGAGAAWVFVRAGSTWVQQGSKLTGGEESGSGFFGCGVALSVDGSTALIGGDGDSGGAGAAWVFVRAGSTWTQQGPKLTRGGPSGEGAFGLAVALSGHGDTALIGGPWASGGVGAAWTFARAGSTWTQQGSKLTGGEESGEEIGAGFFGAAVALSADAGIALIGGPHDQGDAGAGWIFANPPPTVVTGMASNVGSSGATLNGVVDAGPWSSAYFEYGTTVAYGASSAAQAVGAAGSSSPLMAAVGGLARGATYHFRIVAENSAGVSYGADHVFRTGRTSAASPARAVPTAPVLAGVAQSHRVWRENNRLASFSRRRRRAPLGTTFSFALNEQASVSFAFIQSRTGRRVDGRCVARTRRNRHRRACERAVTRGTLSFVGHAGANSVYFLGRISRSEKLRPGRYTLLIEATNAAGQRSIPERLRFAISRR